MQSGWPSVRAALALVGLLALPACENASTGLSGDGVDVGAAPPAPTTTAEGAGPGLGHDHVGPVEPASAPVTRPPWLGTRPLPLRADGFGEIQPTPGELEDRRLPSVDILAPPPTEEFSSTVEPVPEAIAARSTWSPACPVALADLRYVTVAFWGFDERHHTGELLVHAEVADDVVDVFRRLHQARFPIEEMRVTGADELDAHPTGDGNNTGAFVCRPSRGTASWSEHAYGRAVDINPFHNPYVKDDVVLPELASAYADRSWARPGMILPGEVVTAAFADLGWGWGGDWRTTKDYMHFSTNGR